MYDGLAPKLGTDWAKQTCTEIEEFAAIHADELFECTKAARFPRELYEDMGLRGWIGPITNAESGGLGGGVADYCLICEEVARHGLVSPQISVQGQRWLSKWGSPQQQDTYLRGIARGEVIFSESISEPDAASSLKDLRASARRDGGDWILEGRKTHVNLGHQSDVTLVYANAEGSGLTAFLVDTSLPGVSSRQTDPIGLRLLPTADMWFESVRVPSEAVLGSVGGGLETFLGTFNVSRLGNASELIGFARRALSRAITYANGREVGSGHVTDFQGIQWIVADCYLAIYAASLARNHAATIADSGADPALATSLAKKAAIDAAELTINSCFSLIGSHGLYTDTDFGQLLADLKVYRVAGGSLEIMRNYIARRVLRDPQQAGLV